MNKFLDINKLFEQDGIFYLGEVMNVPGVLNRTNEVMNKICIARELGLSIDRHAPELRGEAARSYAAAEITTDHECSTLAEAKTLKIFDTPWGTGGTSLLLLNTWLTITESSQELSELR